MFSMTVPAIHLLSVRLFCWCVFGQGAHLLEELPYGTFYSLSNILHPRVILTQIIYHHRYETILSSTIHCLTDTISSFPNPPQSEIVLSLWRVSTVLMSSFELQSLWNQAFFECIVWCFGWKHSGPVGWHVSSAITSELPSLHTNWWGLVLSNNSRPLVREGGGRRGDDAGWHLHEGKLGKADRRVLGNCESGVVGLHPTVTERMIEWRVAYRSLSKLKVSAALTSS